jgi:hypothetical protein
MFHAHVRRESRDASETMIAFAARAEPPTARRDPGEHAETTVRAPCDPRK